MECVKSCFYTAGQQVGANLYLWGRTLTNSNVNVPRSRCICVYTCVNSVLSQKCATVYVYIHVSIVCYIIV